MNIFYPEHRLLLQKLLETKVDFMLIGGYAVIFHGYTRVTGDMDIWIQPDNENKKLLTVALAQLGFDKTGLTVINNWDFTRPQVFHIGQLPERTDFMTHIAGVKYKEAKEIAVIAGIDGLMLPFIHINSLIQNKKAGGRAKDLADVEYLEKILELRNKKL